MRGLALFSLLAFTVSAAPTSRSETLREARSFTIPFSQKRAVSAARHLRKRQATNTSIQAPLGDVIDTRYVASLTIAGQNLDVTIDTGSTDTFVFSVQPGGIPTTVSPADLPPLFNNATAQGLVDTGLLYNATYGSPGAFTTTLGDIQLASATLTGSTMSVANLTFANIWQSDSSTGASGLLGLGFPLAGIIYPTILIDLYENNISTTVEQSQAFFPIVPLLAYQGKISQPLFSLLVNRLGPTQDADTSDIFNATFSNGSLTIGDYPPGYTRTDFTFSPVSIVQLDSTYQAAGFPNSTGLQWLAPIEAIYFNGELLKNTTQQTDLVADGNKFYSLFDTGNPSMNLPLDVIQQIVPTGAWANNPQNIVIPCNTPFDLVYQFGGKNISLSSVDTLVPSALAIDSLDYGGLAMTDCQFQAQPETPIPDQFGAGTSMTFAFGDPFFRNAAMVFDYGSIINSAQSPPSIGMAQL